MAGFLKLKTTSHSTIFDIPMRPYPGSEVPDVKKPLAGRASEAFFTLSSLSDLWSRVVRPFREDQKQRHRFIPVKEGPELPR